MENIEANSPKKERPKCPNCKKVLKYEQNYIENKYVKPLEKTHTIVMAHNLNILHYIYKKFVCKNLASVGYYIGGMNESELKLSEKKQIVLASYSMSSEGLDIPTLNAEFLITPKTDIVQTVGRVLRAKHAYSHPIIYDFVDSHDVFQRQWLKRKAYYKKQSYKIIGTNSVNYNTTYNNWKVIYEDKNITNASKCVKPTTIFDKNKNSDSEEDVGSEDEDEKPKDKYLTGVCLLKFKK
jgi:superfamily II DNA or RNA helicase